ncbi:MAG: AGE family epimerase/isomerase [Candidatus Latescibacterota bacterium]
MERRAFFRKSAGIGALLAGISGCKIEHTPRPPRSVDNWKIAGRSLEELREQYRHDLFDDFLPFMDKYVIDHEQGGFMCEVDLNGSRIDSKKHARYEGSGIWTYSYLYNHIQAEKKYLEIAHKSVNFLRKNRPVGDRFWPENYTREGKTDGRPDAGGYGDLFIATGFQEFAKASGESKWWDLAKETLMKVVRLYDRPDYYPAAGQVYLGPKARPIPGARILRVWMYLINLTSQMLEYKSDTDVREVLSRSLKAVIDFHFNPEFNLMNEILNHDMTRPSNEYRQLIYTGNAIETLAMILYEAARIKDKELFTKAVERFKRHVEVAWDDVSGGVFLGLNNVSKNEWVIDKALWAQEEVLIGSLFIVEQTGEPWAKEMFGKMYTYVQDKYPMKKYVYPLRINSANRKTSSATRYDRAENFHHPRHLMLNLLCIDRMLKRGGKVSNLFGQDKQSPSIPIK